jgi:malonate decarboxylase delta subunit
MESFSFETPATQSVPQKAHIGVVGSGDLEVLLEPANNQKTIFQVRTASDGFQEIWKSVFTRFAANNAIDAVISINDFGATPGVVSLRLTQALEVATQTPKNI